MRKVILCSLMFLFAGNLASQETCLVITHRDDFSDDVYSFGVIPISKDSIGELTGGGNKTETLEEQEND